MSAVCTICGDVYVPLADYQRKCNPCTGYAAKVGCMGADRDVISSPDALGALLRLFSAEYNRHVLALLLDAALSAGVGAELRALRDVDNRQMERFLRSMLAKQAASV